MEIDIELAELTTTFSEHVLDSTNAFELIVDDESKLAGLPESAVEVARDSAEKKGKPGWRFTLQGPSYTAVMTYLDDAAIREQVYRVYNKRATEGDFDNRQIIGSILALRDQKAKLLGYENFADLVLEDRMAKTTERARAFVRDLEQRSQEFFEAETRALARKISEASPLVVGVGKQAFYRQVEMPVEQAYAYTKEVMSFNASFADAQEGMCAFLEKRKPEWKGR